MWRGFDGRPYTREQFAEYVAKLNWSSWKPKGVTVHNTAAPTLKQWAESGPKRDQRIKNLRHYYENERGWSAGPHFFVGRELINGFSNPLKRGVHASCYNASHIGLEMAGDFEAEAFNVGDGAKVRDTAVFAVATLLSRLALPANAVTINFHRQCAKDRHACPGKNVSPADFIYRVQRAMGGRPSPLPAAEPSATDTKAIQTALKAKGFDPGPIDGLAGPKTAAAVKAFQAKARLKADGIVGPKTLAVLF